MQIGRHILFIIIGLLAFGFAQPAPAKAETVPAPLHYIGSVEFRPEAGFVGASWTLLIREPELEVIEFGLNSTFGTARLSGPHLDHFQTQKISDDYADVTLYSIGLKSANGADFRVLKINYGGPLFPGGMSMGMNSVSPQKIELTVDSFWFPFDLRFDTDLTSSVTVRINGDWAAVGTGPVTPTETGFRFDQTDPSLDIALMLLSSPEVVRTEDDVIYDARTLPGDRLSNLVEALIDCRAFLNGLAGPAFALPPASIVITDRPEGGYSRGTLIALTDIENEDEESLRQFICHELAHYWTKANAGGPENWLNEAMADHLANMAIREVMGLTIFEERLARYEEQIAGLALPPIWRPDQMGRPPYGVLYRSGPLALAALERKIGVDQFMRFMQAFIRDQIRTTPDLLTRLETQSGREVRLWFEAKLAE